MGRGFFSRVSVCFNLAGSKLSIPVINFILSFSNSITVNMKKKVSSGYDSRVQSMDVENRLLHASEFNWKQRKKRNRMLRLPKHRPSSIWQLLPTLTVRKGILFLSFCVFHCSLVKVFDSIEEFLVNLFLVNN